MFCFVLRNGEYVLNECVCFVCGGFFGGWGGGPCLNPC